MEQKAFDVIVEKLGEVLAKQEFQRAPDESEDGVRLAVFTGENLAYAVAYSMKTKRMELRTCAMTNDGPDKNWKTISSWLYDPQPGESDDVESIVNDFCETVEGPKRVAALQTAAGCGVTLLATAHGAGREDLERRELYRPLLREGLIRRLVLITQREGRRTYTVEELT